MRLPESQESPEIIFDPEDMPFIIRGRSLPENAHAFYQPLIQWLEEYCEEPKAETHLRMEVDYFNSATARQFMNIFDQLDALDQAGKDARISWMFVPSDELIRERGLDFAQLLDLPFEVLAFKG